MGGSGVLRGLRESPPSLLSLQVLGLKNEYLEAFL